MHATATPSMTELLQEASSPEQRDAEVWARCFVEAEGDEGKAKALYVKAKMPAPPKPAAPPAPTHGWCPNCSTECRLDASTCQKCGASFGANGWQVSPHKPKPQATSPSAAAPHVVKTAKSRGIYIILGLFLGCFGIHNFYAGRYGKGAAQLIITVLLGWFVVGLVITAIWALIELFTVKTDGAGDALA